jgi:N-acetylglucosamine kinase-like BadF-type ATPase
MVDEPLAGAFGIDAGGSRTLVRARRSDGQTLTWQRESIAIATVGEDVAVQRLDELLADLADWFGAEHTEGCVASSSMPALGEAAPPASLVETLIRRRLRGRLVFINDMAPLVWSDHLKGCGVVVSSGTGSAVLGRDEAGRFAKVGGHEHILTDQGSAYALARAGLRSATRAVDGVGETTVLVERAEAFYERSLPALGRFLAEVGRARSQVASFASNVLEAAHAGDAVALAISGAQAEALAQCAVAAVDRLDLGPSPRLGLSGGVMRGSGYYRELVLAAIREHGPQPEAAVVDGLDAAMDFNELAAGPDGDAFVASVGGLVLS